MITSFFASSGVGSIDAELANTLIVKEPPTKNVPPTEMPYTDMAEKFKSEKVKVMCPMCVNKFWASNPLKLTCPKCYFKGEGINI